MEEQTLDIPSASKPPPPTDVVGGVRSKAQSKLRKIKSSSKSGSPFRIRVRIRRNVPGGGPPPIKRVKNLTCRTSSTYRQKRDFPQGPPTDDGDRREYGKIYKGEREDVVQWILATSKFEMLDDMTALGAVDMVDRFLSTRLVSRKEADYLGVAALLIAVKYYECRVYITPSLDTLIGYVFDDDSNRLHRDRARIMEKQILDELGWEIDVPNVFTFLKQFFESAWLDSTTKIMAVFYAKLGLWSCHLGGLKLPGQMLAAVALEAACMYTGYKYQGSTGFKTIQLLDYSIWILILHFVGTDYLRFCWWIPFNN